VFGMLLRQGMVVPGDAATTASHIQAGEPMFRLAFATDLAGTACYVAVTAILYDLLRPAGATLSRVAAFLSLTGCAIWGVSQVHLLGALLLLDHPTYLSTAFAADQLEALALMTLRLHTFGTLVGMVFFAGYCAAIGVLIFRSGYLPRLVGVFLVAAGAAWLVDTFAFFIDPPFSKALGDAVQIPGLLGEGSLTLWLLAVGLNAPRWDARALQLRAA
jgi:hypothetical protein